MTFATDVLSFEQHVNTWFVTTEQQVAQTVGQIKADVDVAIQDVDAALQWVVQQTPAIASDLQIAASLIEQVGLASNPEVAAAIAAANIAVQGLNAFAAAANSGKTMPQAVVQGYVAVTSAKAAVSGAKALTAKTPTAVAAAAITAAATAPAA